MNDVCISLPILWASKNRKMRMSNEKNLKPAMKAHKNHPALWKWAQPNLTLQLTEARTMF